MVAARNNKKVEGIEKRFRWLYNFGLNNMGLFLNQPFLAEKFGRISRAPKRYKVYGNSNEKTLVFIAGYVSDDDTFRKFALSLQGKYKVVVINLPMAGGCFKRLTIKELTTYIENIIDDEKLESFDLAGFSFGGVLAVSYATANEDKVDKLILLNVVPTFILSDKVRFLYNLLRPILTTSLFA